MNAFAYLQYVFAVSIAADIPMRSAEVSQPLRVLSLHQLQMEVHSEMELRRECFVVFLVRRAFLFGVWFCVVWKKFLEKLLGLAASEYKSHMCQGGVTRFSWVTHPFWHVIPFSDLIGLRAVKWNHEKHDHCKDDTHNRRPFVWVKKSAYKQRGSIQATRWEQGETALSATHLSAHLFNDVVSIDKDSSPSSLTIVM